MLLAQAFLTGLQGPVTSKRPIKCGRVWLTCYYITPWQISFLWYNQGGSIRWGESPGHIAQILRLGYEKKQPKSETVMRPPL